MDNELKITCPCCNTEIIIDRETDAILKHIEPKKTAATFEEMLDREKEKKSKRTEIFTKALSEEKNKKTILDKKFKKVLSEFEDDGKKPINPLELD